MRRSFNRWKDRRRAVDLWIIAFQSVLLAACVPLIGHRIYVLFFQ